MNSPTVSISINRVAGDVAYCLECAEYRSTFKVQTREVIANYKDEFRTTVICSDCGSKNLRKIQSTSTGLRARTEVAKDV